LAEQAGVRGLEPKERGGGAGVRPSIALKSLNRKPNTRGKPSFASGNHDLTAHVTNLRARCAVRAFTSEAVEADVSRTFA
jgi:hypothetical protein